MKKLLLVLMFVTGTSYAGQNDAATSFATGFADALNVQMGGRPYQAPAQVQVNANVYQSPGSYHYDAVLNETGLRGNYHFSSFRECNHFLQQDHTFNECMRITD